MSKERMQAIIAEAEYGMLASAVDGRPRVRPMAFVLTEDFKLWSSTYAGSGKHRELQANEHVEVCFVDKAKVQLRVTGTVDCSGGPAKKRRLLQLNPRVGRHFTDEHDPNYVHLEITPTSARWTQPGFGEYDEIEL